jgi:hypothetical protein
LKRSRIREGGSAVFIDVESGGGPVRAPQQNQPIVALRLESGISRNHVDLELRVRNHRSRFFTLAKQNTALLWLQRPAQKLVPKHNLKPSMYG